MDNHNNIFKQEIVEEPLQAFHVTCVMHNTRTSQRMIKYNVKSGDSEYLAIREEEKLLEIICIHIRDNNLKVRALNICGDHVHIAIICNPYHLSTIIGKLKSMTARTFNIWRGITLPQPMDKTRGHDPLHDPLHDPQPMGHAPLSNHLWAQKFNRVEIQSHNQLNNVINYIQNNRIKHELPPLSYAIQHTINQTIDKGS